MGGNLGAIGEAYVEIRADYAKLKADFNGLGKHVGDLAANAGQSAQQIGRSITVGLSLPIAGAVAAAAKAAIDYESAFANVKKTVGGTAAEMAVLSEGIRGLSRDIPVSAGELAKLAAVGGQFGVASKDLLGFTRTVAELDVAVDGLSGEEAAAGLVQFGKVAGVADSEIGRLASSLVDLGNKGNSTEGHILELSKRLAGAGAAVGMTAPQIMGLSAAIANMGIEAEAGGTAMSQTIAKIERAVATGGDAVEKFAMVADMSVDQFSNMFKTNAIGAVEAFLDGLGRAKDGGESLTLVLDDVDMSGARVVDTLKRLGQSHGEVSKQVDIATAAYQQGNVHSQEAAEKYKTVESQLQLLWNQIRDVGVILGESLLPAISGMVNAAKPLVDVITSVAKGFNALPEPLKLTIAGAVAGAAALGPLLVVGGGIATTFGALAASGTLTTIASGIAAIGGAALAATPQLAAAAVVVGSVAAVARAGSEAWGLYKDRQEQARLATEQNKSHTVAMAMASKIAGREITDLNEALRILREKAAASKAEMEAKAASIQTVAVAAKSSVQKLAEMRAAVSGLSAETRANIAAEFEMGHTVEQTAANLKLSAEVVGMYKSRLEATQEKIKKTNDAQREFNDSVTRFYAVMGGQFTLPQAVQDTGARIREVMEELSRIPAKVPDAKAWVPFRQGITDSGTLIDNVMSAAAARTREKWAAVGASISQAIMGAIQGGGNIGQSIGASLGRMGGEKLGQMAGDWAGKAIGGALGSAIGGAAGSIMGPLGTMLGGWVGGKIGDLFKGVSPQVKEARASVKAFEDQLASSLTPAQRAEAGSERWKQTVIAIRDAYIATGRPASEATAAAERLWKSSQQGPEASARAIAEVNAVLEEARVRQEDLAGGSERDYAKMEAAAQKYGISLDALGSGFHGARLEAEFQDVLGALDVFKRNGADMDAVLAGMSDEISKLVQDSLKFGTEIPAAMKPYLQQLADSGKLLDANGNKMTDLGNLKFAETLTQGVDRMVTAIERLGKQLMGVGDDASGSEKKIRTLGDSLDDLPRHVTIDIESRYSSEGEFPGFRRGTEQTIGSWYGRFGQGTLAMLHGEEAVVPREQAMAFALDTLGGSVATPTPQYASSSAPRPSTRDDLAERIEQLSRTLTAQMTTLPDILALALRDAQRGAV